MVDEQPKSAATEDHHHPPIVRPSVSERGAAALVKILLERGYFHHEPRGSGDSKPTTTIRNHHPGGAQSQYGGGEEEEPQKSHHYNYDPRDALLFPIMNNNGNDNDNDNSATTSSTTSSSYITLDRLTHEFRAELHRRGGRWRLHDAAVSLGLSVDILRQRVVPRLMMVANDDGSSSNSQYTLLRQGDGGSVTEVVTAEHLQQQLDDFLLGNRLQQSGAGAGGRMPVAEAAALLRLPVDVALRALEERILASSSSSSNNKHDAANVAVQILLDDHASKVLVHRDYLDRLRSELQQVLVRADAPVDIARTARERGWEVSWVKQLVKDDDDGFHNNNCLPGQLVHGDETYVPHVYTQRLQRSVQDLFATNGYVTAHTCQSLLGIGPQQMKEFVLLLADNNDGNTTDDSAAAAADAPLLLEHCVLHRIAVVAPIVAALQDAMETKGWLDLQLHLPSELLDYHIEDARQLIQEHVLAEHLSSLSSQGGTPVGLACVRSDGALFFSRALVDDFGRHHVSELVRTFARSRARELSSSEAEPRESSGATNTKARQRVVSEDDETTTMTAKEKRRARKALKAKLEPNEDEAVTAVEYGTISFESILQRLLEVHPDLSDLGDTSGESVLAELCRMAFYTDSLQDQCREAVSAELDRLAAEKRLSVSKSGSIRKGGLGDFATIDAAFEDPGCFSNACFMIQAKAKSMDYFVKNSQPPLDDGSKEALEKDFLSGCCADFTRRITEFALYKNNAEDHAFTFLVDEKAPDFDFFSPIDLGCRSNSRIYLSSGQRDPLPLLREELPGSVGVALARQWILCGGECYKGGEKSTGGGVEAYVRPGDVDGFLAHVHENCLPVCGLPFTKLDKKNEKKFLNARRQRIVLLLEETADAATALDLAIMLLYQLAKNLVVSGAPSLLRGPILRVLTKERKVSETVSAELTAIAEKLENNVEAPDADQLERIRGCVLTKPKI